MDMLKKILYIGIVKYGYNLLKKYILISIWSGKKLLFSVKIAIQKVFTNYCNIMVNKNSGNKKAIENIENWRIFSNKSVKLENIFSPNQKKSAIKIMENYGKFRKKM